MEKNKKTKKVLGMPLALFVAGLLVIGAATAAILTYYVNITGDTTVSQSVVFYDDGATSTSKQYAFAGNIFAGSTFSEMFTIKNRASIPATVALTTSCSAASTNCNGIDWSYTKPLVYTEQYLAADTHLDGTDVTVETTDEWVTWTMETTEFGTGGQAAFTVIIGQGDDILYQIHSNDGAWGGEPFGTWLYLPYDDGWDHDNNELVDGHPWVETTGDRYVDDTFTISIHRDVLGAEFKWAVNMPYDGYKSLPENFGWSNTDTTNFYTAALAEEITGPFTLEPEQEFSFTANFDFHIALVPDTFNIETRVVPAE